MRRGDRMILSWQGRRSGSTVGHANPGEGMHRENVVKKQLAAIVLSMLALMMFAPAAGAVVMRVVVVDTPDAAAYTSQINKGQAMLKRLKSNAILRVWRARFAGADTGKIVVSIEYADMVTLAKDEARAMADPEYKAWLDNLGTMRKILSDSTYDELGR